MFCQINSYENVNGWNYTQKVIFYYFLLYHIVAPEKKNSFTDSRVLEMFVAIFHMNHESYYLYFQQQASWFADTDTEAYSKKYRTPVALILSTVE